jgi:hypothetical protein
MRRTAGILLLATALAGCGGGTASAPTTSTGGELTVGGQPDGGATTPTRPEVAFPATTADGVLALAALRPTGKVAYTVTIGKHGSTPARTYRLDLASNDERSSLHQSQASGDLWVGFDITEGRVAWSCSAPPGGTPTCHDGDPDGVAGRAAAAVAALLGNDVILTTFAPLNGAAGAGLGPDDQAGVPVSCLAGTVAGTSRRLCVSQTGAITEMTAGTTSVRARSVSAATTAADLDQPAPTTP